MRRSSKCASSTASFSNSRTTRNATINKNPFAFYLAALIYESDQKWDDAYISYKSAYDVVPGYLPLHEDLVRSAIRAQRPEDVDKWLKLFPEVKIRPEWKIAPWARSY